MKRLHIFALIFALLLAVPLSACKKEEAPRGDVIPDHATYTFAELRGFEIRGEAASQDAAYLAAIFAEDHVVHVMTDTGVQTLRDFVECVDGGMTLVHYVGDGKCSEQDGVTVFERYVCERESLGSYEGREMTLSRPLFEGGYVKNGEMVFSILEPSGSAAFVYELVFVKD